MCRFLIIYFILLLFAAGSTPVSGAVSEPSSGGDRFYVLEYEDVKSSPRAKVVDIGERMKRLTRQTIPLAGQDRSVHEVYIELAVKDIQPRFSVRLDKKNNLRVTLPDKYQEFLAEPEGVTRLMSWLVLARVGAAPEQERLIRNSWYVTGMSRKVLEEMSPKKTPFAGYFPAAYALTSYDIYPSMQSLLSTPLVPVDASLRLVYEEYCELFLMICARNGLFKSPLLADIVNDSLRDPSADSYALFKKHALAHLAKKESRMFTEEALKQPDRVLNEWFQKELNRLLNWNFLPASAQKVELAYNAATLFSGFDRQEGKKEFKGGICDLALSWEKLKEPEMLSGAMAERLAGVSRIAPPDLTGPLTEVRTALNALQTDRSPQAFKRVKDADTAFFRALEQHIALEKFLSDTERDCVSPAARYYLSFKLLDFSRRSFGQPMAPLADFLDKVSRNAGEL